MLARLLSHRTLNKLISTTYEGRPMNDNAPIITGLRNAIYAESLHITLHMLSVPTKIALLSQTVSCASPFVTPLPWIIQIDSFRLL